MKRVITSLVSLCLAACLAFPAGALDYTIAAPGDPEYGDPTSIEPVITADGGAAKNEDRSKNAARIPPAFGSPSAYALNTGTYLTPNLAPGGQAVTGAVINGGSAVVVTPGTPVSTGSGSTTSSSTVFTEVTSNLYYSGGYLATLKIPAVDLNVKVYQGTGSSVLAKGAGHFPDTSIWDGNVCIAGHNRGVRDDFGDLHTLNSGDTITWTTKLGTRTYKVVSVQKVLETDTSGTASTSDDRLTLYTCVRNQRDYRWCVVAVAE